MSTWILLIWVGGWNNPVIEQSIRYLPQAQCKTMADQIAESGRIYTQCFGPNGEYYIGKEVKE